MKHFILVIAFFLSVVFSFSQNDRSLLEKLNHDESKVPEYTLPDPLTLNNGKKVTTVKQWEKQRRQEILELFSSQMYGRTPKEKMRVSYETLSENPHFLNGKATAKQVKFIFTNGSKKHEALLLLVLPNAIKGKVPVFVAYNFKGNHCTNPDTSIIMQSFFSLPNVPDYIRKWPENEWGRGCDTRFCFDKIIDRGYGIATMSYQDIYPDTWIGEEHSVISLFPDYRPGTKSPDQWNAIGAWAWGSSRIVDYLETQKRVDTDKIIIMGHSRQGKAALWAGAQDQRFKMVISNNSGCCGAALSKRVFGESIELITNWSGYWFCPALQQYANNEAGMPFDQHELVALIAPRLVYIASAVEDIDTDPKGEFLAGYHAGSVYELYGLKGLGDNRLPPLNHPVMHDIGYHIRKGDHDVTDYDWDCFMDFADIHFGKPEALAQVTNANETELNSTFRGVRFENTEGSVRLERFFGFPCITDNFMLEAGGLFLLNTEAGRYEDAKWEVTTASNKPGTIALTLRSKDRLFTVESRFEMDSETGVLSRKDVLINNDKVPHTIFSAVPRVPLHAEGFEIYGQTGGWCAENDGRWSNTLPGTVELHNTMGRTTENANPYLAIRQKATGTGIAMHVLPVGDWIMRVKTLAGHKTAYTVLELGLSDRGLRLDIAPGERLELPETLYYSFESAPENASERLHCYLMKRYPNFRRPEAVYNTWFFCFDDINAGDLKEQIVAAKEVGCRYFVVDAGWFGEGQDWDRLVGDWKESTTKAFYGKLSEFAGHVRSQGLKFGLWIDPESVTAGTPIYREHKDWFIPGDAIIFNLYNPEAYQYLYDEITRLIRTYSLSWIKIDFNLKMQSDLTGSNFYRYYRAWNALMDRIVRENPDCVFEGCASGGHRTDIENTLNRFAGHFISDTVNPLEALNMHRNAMQRSLPQCLGTWYVAHQIHFPVASYFDRDAKNRRKTLVSADAWWLNTLDLDIDFCMKAMILGNAGFSGNLASFDTPSRSIVRKWIDFYHENAGFFKQAVSCAHTVERGINDPTGWHVLQYSLQDGSKMMIFAFRVKDNTPKFCVFPKHIEAGKTYKMVVDREEKETLSGERIQSQGIVIECADAYSAHVVELIKR